MKISGRTLALSQDTLSLRGGEIQLLLTGLPIGADDRLRAEIPRPRPPATGFARDSRGKFLRDEDTGKPIALYDEHDAAYQDALRKSNRLFSVLMIVEGLRNDPNVQFDVQRDGHKSGADYAEAIYQEFQQSGLVMGELTQILRAVMAISGMRDEEMEAARNDFLPSPGSARAGSSPAMPAEPNSTGVTGSGSASASPPENT